MKEQNDATEAEETADIKAVEVERLVMRFRKKVEEDENKYSGREQEYNFHGGFTSGYNRGKLSAYEDIADLFGIDIDV